MVSLLKTLSRADWSRQPSAHSQIPSSIMNLIRKNCCCLRLYVLGQMLSLVYTYTFLYTHTHTHTYIYIYMCVCVCVCVYVCVCVCVCVCFLVICFKCIYMILRVYVFFKSNVSTSLVAFIFLWIYLCYVSFCVHMCILVCAKTKLFVYLYAFSMFNWICVHVFLHMIGSVHLSNWFYAGKAIGVLQSTFVNVLP